MEKKESEEIEKVTEKCERFGELEKVAVGSGQDSVSGGARRGRLGDLEKGVNRNLMSGNLASQPSCVWAEKKKRDRERLGICSLKCDVNFRYVVSYCCLSFDKGV